MTISNIVEINRVLERDRTDTTYKFALLRGAADIAQQHNPYTAEGRVWYKTGLMVEKWLEYYYPIFDSDVFIPQKNGEMPLSHDGKNVSFRRKFKRLTDYYSSRGGFNAFWTQYKNGTIDEEINDACLDLVKDIWRTITYYPMKHLGYSIKNEHYSYFGYAERKPIRSGTPFSRELLVDRFGDFWMDGDFWR